TRRNSSGGIGDAVSHTCRTRPGPAMSASAIRSPGATMRCGAPFRPRCAVPPRPGAPVGFSKLIARESRRVSMRAGSPKASNIAAAPAGRALLTAPSPARNIAAPAMELAANLALGWQVAAAAGRIGSDRISASFGRGLPATPEAIALPGALDEILRAGTPDGCEPLPRVTGVRLPGVEFESSNWRNFLGGLGLECADSAQRGLPATAYVKLPCRSLTTRVFANALGFWALECTFCRTLAHRVPIRVPRVYAVAQRGSRFALVLEDLTALPGVR